MRKLPENTLQIGSQTYASTDFTEAQWKSLPGKISTAKNKESSDASKSTPTPGANSLLKEIAPKSIVQGADKEANDIKRIGIRKKKTAVDEWITSQYEASGKTKWPTDPKSGSTYEIDISVHTSTMVLVHSVLMTLKLRAVY